MKINQIILEYSREVTAQKLGATLLQKFQKEPAQWQERIHANATKADPAEVLDHLLSRVELADPTKNKQYVPWIIRTYVNNPSFKFEDAISKVGEPLTKFYKLVQKKQIPAPNNDIGRIKDLAGLVQVVDQFPDVEDVQQERGDAKEIYKDADLRIIKPADQTAACYYGQGTRWCTAAQNNNMFNTYAEKGELYIIIPTKPAHRGEKYQFHFETKQFMDEKDRRANLSELRQRYPQLADIFEKQAIEHNVLALRKDIDDLNAVMQTAMPIFIKSLETLIGRDSRRVVFEISKELGTVVRVFRGADEVIELTEELLDEKAKDFAMMAANIIRNDPDLASDEDQLHDMIANDLTDIVRDSELWLWCMEVLEDMEDEEAEFDVAMTIEGEVNAMLRELIPVAFAEAINAAKEQTKQGIEK
jgi:hypothetical protein